MNKLLLVDGNSLVFRGFYALYRQLDNFVGPNGLHTNAIYAFKNMLDHTLQAEHPSHVLVAFDAGKVTFRTKMFSEYKGGRQKTPSELLEQIPVVREMLSDLGIKSYDLPNYEADDILGTMAKKGEAAGFEVKILTGDKDLTQLASDQTTVLITKNGASDLEAYTPEHMKEVNGVTPTEFIDMKALMGDNSDNYPGVTKVGPKSASKLIQEFGSVENLYEHIDDLKASKMKENLIKDRDVAFLSKKLATIVTDAPIELTVEDTKLQDADQDKLMELYSNLGMNKFLSELQVTNVKVEQTELEYQVLKSADQIKAAPFTFDLCLLGENYHEAEIIGFSIEQAGQIYVSTDLDLLKTLPLTSADAKAVFDLKKTIVALNRLGLKIEHVDYDMMLAAYLVDSDQHATDIGTLVKEMFPSDQQVATFEATFGKGKKMALPAEAELEHYLAEQVFAINYYKEKLINKMHECEQEELFTGIELPLAAVLAKMEITGMKIEAGQLVNLQNEFAIRLDELEKQIYELAGSQFNINSPKQLGKVLFEDLALPVIKKTKTGYSTSADVLEKLKGEPIVAAILDYRQLAKLQSTYVSGLLAVIKPDGRIHSRYLQTQVATGRLSSVDPNLQNIPMKTQEGRQIRKAFVPSTKDGYLFSCDYSQVELRVLSHVAGEEQMQHAFKTGYDIHAHTAMKIFHLDDPSQVTKLMRRQAKAVNFGIVYGISDYGLANQLEISRAQAASFIDQYFAQYPKIKTYMDDAVKKARELGFSETIMHRRRYLPDIHAKNFNVRKFAERVAINAPIQGSAADIIKIAMINLDRELTKRNLKSKLVLQVHDELILDVDKDEIDEIKALVPEVMQNAVKLDVPLIADSGYGHDWYEAK
ncbi:MAG: DNA polymerase I [Lactobacillus sp.]|nr:DNA polymerase I [Lactobacillus sp.]